MKKILLVLLLIPFIVFNIFSLNVDQPIFEQELDEINKITVTKDGFLECGEIIYISQSKLGIFDKKVFQFNNLCLKGINKIETVKFEYTTMGNMILKTLTNLKWKEKTSGSIKHKLSLEQLKINSNTNFPIG